MKPLPQVYGYERKGKMMINLFHFAPFEMDPALGLRRPKSIPRWKILIKQIFEKALGPAGPAGLRVSHLEHPIVTNRNQELLGKKN